MTWKRAAMYTWRAFLTFLLVSLPGLIPQIVITGLLAAWTWADGGNGPTASVIGLISSLRALANLWIYFAILFVVFKYLPAAIAEVQGESRRDQR